MIIIPYRDHMVFGGRHTVSIGLCSQVVFLALAYATVYLIYMRFRSTYDSENDTFRVEFLLVPTIGLSFLENYAFTPLEVYEHQGRVSGTFGLRCRDVSSMIPVAQAMVFFSCVSLPLIPSRSCGPSPSSWRRWP